MRGRTQRACVRVGSSRRPPSHRRAVADNSQPDQHRKGARRARAALRRARGSAEHDGDDGDDNADPHKQLTVHPDRAEREADVARDPRRGARVRTRAVIVVDLPKVVADVLKDHIAELNEDPVSRVRELYPQFFAMVALGFATGLRPSTLRPLRRGGPTPDINWETGVLQVRRSNTIGEEVMETTKTKRHQTIALPPELIDMLKWHVETSSRRKRRLNRSCSLR